MKGKPAMKTFEETFGIPKVAWMGGDWPSKEEKSEVFKQMRRFLYKEQVNECGGLDLWVCAGTSVLERARIFWNRATADAWASIRDNRWQNRRKN